MTQKKQRTIQENVISYLFLLPWLLIFFLFVAYPFIYGFYISLFDFNYVAKTFIGLQNYLKLFQDPLFLKSVLATFQMAIIILPCTVVLSLWIANTIANRARGMQTFTKVSFYLSSIVSEVALVVVWKWMFSPAFGLSASLTDLLGIARIDWFGNASFALPLVSMLVVTFTISQPIILYSAAMNNIPDTYYEAAEIDGAKKPTQFFKITLPLIKPTTTFILITSTIAILQVFTVPYLLTSGGPQFKTTSMLLMIYRNAFEYNKYGYASAMGVALFLLIAIFAFAQFKLTKSDVQY